MKINVSVGEILDRYSILDIKMSKIEDEKKLNNIRNEFDKLTPKVDSIYSNSIDVETLELLYTDLYNINITLWNVENLIRQSEVDETFGKDFIELARSVYHFNDERSQVKQEINILTNSLLIEEKSYSEY